MASNEKLRRRNWTSKSFSLFSLPNLQARPTTTIDKQRKPSKHFSEKTGICSQSKKYCCTRKKTSANHFFLKFKLQKKDLITKKIATKHFAKFWNGEIKNVLFLENCNLLAVKSDETLKCQQKLTNNCFQIM